MNYKYLFFLLPAIVLSCSREKVENVSAPELIKSIEASQSSNNALRMNISVEFKSSVTYQIEYWKKGDDHNKRKTESAGAVGAAQSTLVLLEPNTEYDFRILASSGSASTVSKIYSFQTGLLPGSISNYTLPLDILEGDLPGYILLAKGDKPGYIAVTDTKGKIVWYENIPEGVKVVNYDAKSKIFVAITGNNPGKSYTGQKVIAVDLFGNRILDRESGDLYPHHDIRLLPDGNIILVNYVPRKYDLSAYGGGTSEVVWGDGFTIMDLNGNIKKQWDCFYELNPQDDPEIMNSKKDWLHANSVNFDSNGDYYMTFNTVSELWKINKETGVVQYRVGRKGNTTLNSNWFANGLHSPYPLDPNRILVLDNGRTTGSTRAMIYSVNPTQKQADVSLEVVFPREFGTPFMGNATLVKDNLMIFGSSTAMAIVFTDLSGKVLRVIGSNFSLYRAEYIPEIKY